MNPTDWERLGRYLAGESSPEEAAAVRRWMEEHPSDAQVIDALDAATKGLAPSAGVDVEGALQNVKTRMHAPAPVERRAWRRYAPLAAAAALLLAVGLVVGRRVTSRSVHLAKPTTYATSVGERKEVLLPDGTQVMLGPATRLIVRGRVAELDGEALFSVVHDAKRPFTVSAGDATITDIGTDFTVHSDSGEAVRVVVSEGIVALSYGTDSVTLAGGDVGTLQPGGRVAAQRGAATDDDLAWTLGKLVFRDASLAELAADLRRWYGVELHVSSADSAMMRRHFTGSFGKESAAEVLDVIALALGARVDRRGDTVYLRPTSPIK